MGALMMAPAASAARRGTFLEDLGQVVHIPHRGGGGNLGRDTARSSVPSALAIGLPAGANIVDGGDFWETSDGHIGACHDSNTGRTLDAAGLISGMTLAQFQALSFRDFPLVRNTVGVDGTEHPAVDGEWLDLMRTYNLFSTPELKATSNNAADVLRAAIVARGMERNALVASFQTAVVSRVNSFAPTIPTFLLHSANNIRTPAQILIAVNGGPPTVVGYDFTDTTDFTDSWLSQVIAGGVTRLSPYTSTGRRVETDPEIARLLGLGATQVLLYTDDPFYSGRHPSAWGRTTDRWATQSWEHGYIPSSKTALQSSDTSATTPVPYIDKSVGRLRLADGTHEQAILLGAQTPKTGTITSVTVTVTFDALDTTTTRWAFIAFGPDDRERHEFAGTDSLCRGTGYTFAMRQNGQTFIARRDPGTGSPTGTVGVVLATSPTSGAGITTIPTGGTATIKAEKLGDGRLRLTRLDTGLVLTTPSADNTFTLGAVHLGKAGLAGQKVSYSSLTVA